MCGDEREIKLSQTVTICILIDISDVSLVWFVLICMLPLEKETSIENNDDTNQSDYDSSDELLWKKVKSLRFIQNNREQLVTSQAKCLCSQYVRARLKRAGILNRKVLQRLRDFLDTPSAFDVHEVFPALNTMCEELERMHPRVYMNISRHLSRAPFGELEEAHTAPYLLNAVAKDLFKNGINWAKIVSIFTVSGGLAVDIVRQGHYDYLPRLIESTGDIVEDDLVPWLLDHGGWSGLLEHIRPTYYYFDRQFTPSQWLTIATSALFIFYVISFIIRSAFSSS